MRFVIIALLSFVFLTGCAKEISERAIQLTMPDVIEYDKETQSKAAAEMDKYCPVIPTLCQFIVDYGVMRDQARVAAGQKVNINR